ASQQNVANLTEQFQTSSNVIVVTDQVPFERQGPLSGIFAATNYSPELTDYLLLAVDYPLITTTILTTLVTQTDCYATTPTQDHYLVSHVQASQDMVRAHLLLGDLRVSHFIKTTCQGLPVTFPDSQAFTNLNNMEALTNAK
ncbi:MAG: NTP transferase domain-containing protein, partial [Lactiplantibacillus plantarum]|nr:NTP transferase domain-containing protein [Lactiplantibacillus plantarum]